MNKNKNFNKRQDFLIGNIELIKKSSPLTMALKTAYDNDTDLNDFLSMIPEDILDKCIGKNSIDEINDETVGKDLTLYSIFYTGIKSGTIKESISLTDDEILHECDNLCLVIFPIEYSNRKIKKFVVKLFGTNILPNPLPLPFGLEFKGKNKWDWNDYDFGINPKLFTELYSLARDKNEENLLEDEKNKELLSSIRKAIKDAMDKKD